MNQGYDQQPKFWNSRWLYQLPCPRSYWMFHLGWQSNDINIFSFPFSWLLHWRKNCLMDLNVLRLCNNLAKWWLSSGQETNSVFNIEKVDPARSLFFNYVRSSMTLWYTCELYEIEIFHHSDSKVSSKVRTNYPTQGKIYFFFRQIVAEGLVWVGIAWESHILGLNCMHFQFLLMFVL